MFKNVGKTIKTLAEIFFAIKIPLIIILVSAFFLYWNVLVKVELATEKISVAENVVYIIFVSILLIAVDFFLSCILYGIGEFFEMVELKTKKLNLELYGSVNGESHDDDDDDDEEEENSDSKQ